MVGHRHSKYSNSYSALYTISIHLDKAYTAGSQKSAKKMSENGEYGASPPHAQFVASKYKESSIDAHDRNSVRQQVVLCP